MPDPGEGDAAGPDESVEPVEPSGLIIGVCFVKADGHLLFFRGRGDDHLLRGLERDAVYL